MRRPFRLHACLPRERVHLLAEDMLERLLDRGRRTNRVRNVPQGAVERREPCLEGGEASTNASALRRVERRDDLVAREPNVVRERDDLLQQAVVKVAGEAGQSLLGPADERAPLEEKLALEER
jgi:hypothetical protein